MFKSLKLNRGNITRIVGCSMNDYGGQVSIVPVSKRGRGNSIVGSGSGEYDGGDRVIGFTCGYEVDGDLLFTVGWGDGFAVRRLNNDGTMTRLFWENNFLWRDTGSTYNHLQSVAIDKVNKKGVVMTYNVEGYTTFDYSGLMNGGTTFVKHPRPTHSNPDFFIGSQDTGNGYVNRVGSSYFGGLAAAGPWIYAGDHDAHHYKKVMRRNIHTGVEERLDATDRNVILDGTAPVDRNGYRYYIAYDEVNDRIYYMPYYNGSFIVVTSASTSNPKTVWCDKRDMGYGDDGYEQGLFVFDPVNEPNIVSVGSATYHIKIDITPCFSGNAPTFIARVNEQDPTKGNQFGVYMRAGTKYQSTQQGQPTDKMVGHPEFLPISPDRGKAMSNYGWVDYENGIHVAQLRPNNVTEDTSSYGRGNTHWTDYGQPVFRMYSANGTEFWVQTGYGYNGHSFRIWGDQYKNELIPNWEIDFNLGGLDNNAPIDFIHWSKEGHYAPSGCTLSLFVSNDNGQTWESYTGTDTGEHVFSNQTASGSSSNRLRCRMSGAGTVAKNAYKMAQNADQATFGTMHAIQTDSAIREKITRYSIEGKK